LASALAAGFQLILMRVRLGLGLGLGGGAASPKRPRFKYLKTACARPLCRNQQIKNRRCGMPSLSHATLQNQQPKS